MKPNDILLEFNGKPVPNTVHEFVAKLLDNVKADTKVDVVVLRKGKKETINALVVPEEVKAGANVAFPQGGAAVLAETIQRSNLRQGPQLIPAQSNALFEVSERGEGELFPLLQQARAPGPPYTTPAPIPGVRLK